MQKKYPQKPYQSYNKNHNDEEEPLKGTEKTKNRDNKTGEKKMAKC